ncbi:amidase, Asp-tRNAAsn/Glu-tRNAGln amidotransferase A subunit [Caulobacter sp. AP07]|uniref:amidase n=1 Tax=Caulobacter sp. AP07 TaxID=1144304 RepID=UPI000271E8D4|nr:amidase family protein [Caulobacter sp. AP07]EJL30783.1 amidase, Asp-tRNAAsn/Glu-tRNAGln amidotransferase A subunit [Caulobacter sp. AP07]
MDEALHWLDATEIAERIRTGQVTAAAVLEHYLERVARINPILNCIVALDETGARARAAQADAALARGELWGPLHGVPITIKDTFEVVGMPCTAGSPFLKDHRPTQNATPVQRLLDAGAIIFGKTNVPVFAADLATDNPLHGVTGNAWDPSRIAGGSSGGSAVALAAGLTSLELGSDFGGSSRNPAHYNNVFGMRPSWGTISGIGHIPGMPGSLTVDEIGTPGPMARSARDLRLAFDIVRGGEPRFGWVSKPELPDAPITDLGALRVALWMDDEIAPVDRAVSVVLERALEALKVAGLTQQQAAKPDFDVQAAYDLYIRMGGAITGAGTPPDQREALRKTLDAYDQAGVNDSDVQRTRGVLCSFADFVQDSQLRGEIRVKWAEYFERYDIMLSPIIGLPAIEHGPNYFGRTITINGQSHMGRDQLFWAAHQALANLPGVVFPAGFTDDGLPIGLQVTAPYLQDYRAIRVAERLAAALGFAERHPADRA